MSETEAPSWLRHLNVTAPNWLRGLKVIFGLVLIILTVVILSYPNLGQLNQIFMLATAILIVGLARIFVGMFAKHIPFRLRAFNVVLGIFAVAVTLTAIINQLKLTQTLIQLLSLVLLFHGANSVMVGRYTENLSRFSRGTLFALGVLCIALSVWTLLIAFLALSTSIDALAVGYLAVGIAEIVEATAKTRPRK